MEEIKKNKGFNKNKVFLFIITLITLTFLFFFFKEIIVELIGFYLDNNVDAAKELLESKGLFGCFIVVLVEALQMIVVFISAEFIQISAGLSYPWYIAVGLCLLGVFFGSSIIFALVRVAKFDTKTFAKSTDKINEISNKKKNLNIQMLMYLLFIMPVIPIGAVCYFGANTKISYRRYIFTCVSGVIPEIFSSILLGKIIKFAIIENIPAGIVVLAIILVMILLITLGFVLASKAFFKENEGTPDSIYYDIFYKIYKMVLKGKVNTKFDTTAFKDIEGPFILLTNHPSSVDVYYASSTVFPKRLTFIMNKYYFKFKLFKFVFKKFGGISKKLFSPDIGTIKGTIRAVKAGYPVFMCPEGRLGLDGTNYYITKETGKFIKQLKLPIVIMTINGAYLSKPKWRKHRIKTNVETKVTRIVTQEEVMTKTANEINDIINECLSYNDFEYAKKHNLKFKNKHKAEGLENVLYHCPHCHSEFKMATKGNVIKCNQCGFSLKIEEDYHFENNEYGIKTIHDWYELIKVYEKQEIEKGINLSCQVKIKKFNIDNKKLDEKGSGICYLTNNEFRYEGDLKVPKFTIAMDHLKALAFSCGEEFECYYNDELYYFYPIENKEQCAKWALIVDELVKDYE